MIHQPSGGANGPAQATDINIVAKHILDTKQRINRILARNTGKEIDQIERDSDRDNYMSTVEARDYGLVDSIIE